MARINKKAPAAVIPVTHEGAPAVRTNDELALRRSVMATMLWEDQFYEDGQQIAQRIETLISRVSAQAIADMAIEARDQMKLRHIPLLLASKLAALPAGRPLVAKTLSHIIQRPDELYEFLAIYWKDGKRPLAAQVKKGLAEAFPKFNEYSLAKYRGDDKAIKLRDVMFLTHPKPRDAEQAALWKRLAENKLETPDTWEVELSAGKDKKETWTRLMAENKLGILAFLRNLRNMQNAGVELKLIRDYLYKVNPDRALPFRFISAARFAPDLEPDLEKVMFKSLESHKHMPGKTVLLIDVSGSMDDHISTKSDLTRLDAACALSMLAREICQDVKIHTFSHELLKVPPRRGFALKDAIINSQPHGGTYLGAAVEHLNKSEKYDRLIVFTDEQSHDRVGGPVGRGYMINVASNQNGVGYGDWNRITGFSEAIMDYILAFEKLPR